MRLAWLRLGFWSLGFCELAALAANAWLPNLSRDGSGQLLSFNTREGAVVHGARALGDAETQKILKHTPRFDLETQDLRRRSSLQYLFHMVRKPGGEPTRLVVGVARSGYRRAVSELV